MYAFNNDKSKADFVLNTGAWNNLGMSVSSITTSGGTITWNNFDQLLSAYHEIAVVFAARVSTNPSKYESRGTIIFGTNMISEGFQKLCLDGDSQYQTFVSFSTSGSSVTATFSSVVKRSETIFVQLYGIGPKE